MENKLCTFVLILSLLVKVAPTFQWENCSNILCPTRANECAVFDEDFKCGKNSIVIPNATDDPISIRHNENSAYFEVNAFSLTNGNNLTFDKAYSFWNKLYALNTAELMIKHFCDMKYMRQKWFLDFQYLCIVSHPTFDAVNIDYFSPMNSVLQLTIRASCVENVIGSLQNGFPNLQELNLEDNFLQELPTALRNATNIRRLILNNNFLRNISKDDFANHKLLKKLELGVNCIHNLPEDVFVGLTQLENLELYDNHLETLPENLLAQTTNLIEFNAAANKLKQIPSKLFRSTPHIESIFLSNNQLSSLPQDLFRGLNQLKNIYLQFNHLSSLPPNIFTSGILQDIKLSNNHFTELPEIKFGSGLRGHVTIDLSSNQVTTITGPIINKISKVNRLILSNNCLNFVPVNNENYTLLTDVNIGILEITCENCCIDFIHSQMFFGVKNALHLSRNNIKELNMEDLKFLSTLINVDLSYNTIATISIVFQYPIVRNETSPKEHTKIVIDDNQGLICDCRSLLFAMFVNNQMNNGLYLSGLKFDRVSFDVNRVKCAGPESVTNRSLVSLPESLFFSEYPHDCPKNCTCLLLCFESITSVECNNANLDTFPMMYPDITKHLRLNFPNNNISVLPEGNDLIWTRITHLDLKNNKISSLIKITNAPLLKNINLQNNNLSQFEQEVSKLIDPNITDRVLTLSGNPWKCNCNLRHTRDIFFNTTNIDIPDEKRLTCISSGKVHKLLDFNAYCEITSHVQNMTLVLSLSVLSAFVFIFSIASVIFVKYKIHIKYFLFSKNLCLWWVSEEDLDADKQFDAFITYSNLDGEWVNRVLIPGLENEDPRYKVCFHERDWPGGTFVADQIVQSVKNSRRTIVVLTDNFLTSDWSRVEFSVAFQQAVEDNVKRVVVVVPDKLPDLQKCDSEFRSFVELTTYVEFNKPYFWRKLRCFMPRRRQDVGQ